MQLKVILLENVPKLGKKWEIVNVKSGYFNNYLMPKYLATLPNKAILMYAKRQLNKMMEEKNKNTTINISHLNNKKFTTEQSCNDKGILFGALHEKEIADIIKNDISSDMITLAKAIKETGEYKISISNGIDSIEISLIVKSK